MEEEPKLSAKARQNRNKRARQREREKAAIAVEHGSMGVELLPKPEEATHLRKETEGEREYWSSRVIPPKLSDVELEMRAYRERWATPDGAERVATNALVKILLNDNATDKLKADVATKIMKIGESKIKAAQVEMAARQLRLMEQGEAPLTFENDHKSGGDDGYRRLIQSAKTLEELDVILALAERVFADVA